MPESVTPENVATPFDAATVSVPPRVPVPDWMATVTCAVSSSTRLPAASRMATTGCVVSAEPEVPATGCVVIASCVASPAPETWRGAVFADVSTGLEVNCST